jgi:low temperature requirement protein LtrA
MAANAKDALDSRSSAGFGAAYAAMRIILVIQYIRARRIPATRKLTTHYAIGFGMAASLWLVSALAPVPFRYWIWGIALVIDMATPLLALNDGAKFPPDAAHLPERFGLFTIILLGESVAAVMRGMESQEYWSLSAAASAILGLCLTFTIWWWYFDGANGAAERHLKTKKQTKLFHLWSYAHLPLYLGIAVVAVGAEHVISMAPERHFRSSESWIISLAAFVTMAALVTIGFSSDSAQRESGSRPAPRMQFLIAALALPVGFIGDKCSPVFLVLGLAILCALQLLLVLRQNLQSMKLQPSSEALDFG